MAFFKKSASKDAAPAKAGAQKTKAAEAKVEAPKAEKKAAPATTGEAHRVLIRPIVTEKSSAMGSKGAYVFAVNPKANKLQIKAAVKSVYGVDAVAVRVQNFLGKPVRTRSGYGSRKSWKKAVVTLKKGQSLDVFANA